MSLISRVEISNYLTEGLETNHFADWNPMLTGITLRMDSKSALINITNGGGKTSMAELLLFLLSRDSVLLRHLRDKTAPKGRGYTHARIEFRDVDDTSFRAPSLLETDVDNLPGATRVIGVATNNDVTDAPIFYSYSGTLEDSPCYTLSTGKLQNVPDDVFVKRTRSLPGSQWDTFRNVNEWQEHVGLSISMDVVRRNAAYQAKGSDDKNASFFNFKPHNGESYDSAFFKAVIAPDLLTNLLNSFSEDGESSIGDTLQISLSHIVNSERDIARKQASLERRESAIGVDLKPVVDTGARANTARTAMQAALRTVKKDVALLHHFGSQNSPYAFPGLPRPITGLMRSDEQDPRIRKAIKGMVISRDDGILILDKTMGELTGVEVRRIGEIADRKRIPHPVLNSQVIDFACDFENITSGATRGGHYRKGYSRQSVESLLTLLAETSGATLEGLEDVFKAAFDIAQSQIETNPAALKIFELEATLSRNAASLVKLQASAEELSDIIDGIDKQITGLKENKATWEEFSKIAGELPQELQSSPKQAKGWISDQVIKIATQLADMNMRKGELNKDWLEYVTAIDQSGIEGIDGLRKQYEDLEAVHKELKAQVKSNGNKFNEINGKTQSIERREFAAQALLAQCEAALARLEDMKKAYAVFQSYFGDVEPLVIEHPSTTLKGVNHRKSAADKSLANTKSDWDALCALKAGASRFAEIFGPDADALKIDPVGDHRRWTEKEHLAQQGILPLEPLVNALESFEVKFPGQSPSVWIDDTDTRRLDLEGQKRDVEGRLAATQLEITALDQLAIVDDAAFGRAWEVLPDGPQRLYVFLQGLDQNAERRVGALSALSGLLSAPVFDSPDDLEKASALLDEQNIAIPLLLKEPLLKALQSEGEILGELRVMGFFAGRYSRQARILLDPVFAKEQRTLLIARLQDLEEQQNQLIAALLLVDFRSEDYVLATKAAEAIKSNSASKYETYERELKLAQDALHKLQPQIKKDALDCFESRKTFLRKGGDEKQASLWAECENLQAQISKLSEELGVAEKRASAESVNAYLEACKYVREGADRAHESAQTNKENAASADALAKWDLENHKVALTEIEELFAEANARLEQFVQEEGPSRIKRLWYVLDFAKRIDDIQFMESFNIEIAKVGEQSSRFIGFQSHVNFDRADAYYANLGKSDADLVNLKGSKGVELQAVNSKLKDISETSDLIRDAELPEWTSLRKAIHDFAYEIGSQATATQDAHAKFAELEEGPFPVEAHPLYADIQALYARMHSPTIDETTALASLMFDQTFKIQSLNTKDALSIFDANKKNYDTAIEEYAQKNKAFCEKSRLEAGTKLAAFNALELDEIERSTPERIASLVSLFERLNLSLNKDREDAAKAIQAAQNANAEALTQLSRLISVAEDNLAALKAVMLRYPKGCFKIKVHLAGEDLIKEILSEMKTKIKSATAAAEDGGRTLRRSEEGKMKDLLRETLIEKVFLQPEVSFVHGGIRAKESPVTEKLSTGQKVALEFMWIVRQAEYEIERGLRQLSSKQAEKKRQKTNRVIFVDGIFSTLSDRQIIREAFSGLNDLGGNFQIIGFLHSPTWTNDSSVFPVYHVGKKLTNAGGSSLVAFSQEGRNEGTLGFLTTISQANAASL